MLYPSAGDFDDEGGDGVGLGRGVSIGEMGGVSDGRLDNVGVVVLDEVHYLADASRGGVVQAKLVRPMSFARRLVFDSFKMLNGKRGFKLILPPFTFYGSCHYAEARCGRRPSYTARRASSSCASPPPWVGSDRPTDPHYHSPHPTLTLPILSTLSTL